MLQGKRVCDTPEVMFPAVPSQPSLLHLILFLLETTLAGIVSAERI